jgi:hypothetical protein
MQFSTLKDLGLAIGRSARILQDWSKEGMPTWLNGHDELLVRLWAIQAGKVDLADSSDPHVSAVLAQITKIAEILESASPKGKLPSSKAASLGDYDAILGQPGTWTDAKKREEVQGEILLNEVKADERAVSRGKLLTSDQVETREREQDEIVFAQLARLPEFASSLVEADKKDSARKSARDFISDIRKSIALKISQRTENRET